MSLHSLVNTLEGRWEDCSMTVSFRWQLSCYTTQQETLIMEWTCTFNMKLSGRSGVVLENSRAWCHEKMSQLIQMWQYANMNYVNILVTIKSSKHWATITQIIQPELHSDEIQRLLYKDATKWTILEKNKCSVCKLHSKSQSSRVQRLLDYYNNIVLLSKQNEMQEKMLSATF